MAENTPVSRKFLGNTTGELENLHGKERQLVIDTVKNTAVVMDGVTPGGHPLAKESVQIKAGDNITVNGGDSATLGGDITIAAKSSVALYDGSIDFDDEEQVAEITENRPMGSIVAYDCCPDCSTAEDVVVGGAFNTEEWITESGDWTAPVTGTYKITCIGGGTGSFYESTYGIIQGGESGFINSAYVSLDAGAVIPITIGAGGIGHIFDFIDDESRSGGNTYFGEYVNSLPSLTSFIQQPARLHDFEGTSKYLAYGGGYTSKSGTLDGIGYGSGGSVAYTNGNPAGPIVGSGKQGCVIVEYYDASKDRNISVDMASSVTMKELQEQIAALSARVEELENE